MAHEDRLRDSISGLLEDTATAAELLEELAETMDRGRTAYLALRPRELEESLEPMTAIEGRLRQAAAARERRLVEIRALLGGRGELRLSEIEEVAPADLAERLREARERLAGAARRVRVETLPGEPEMRLEMDGEVRGSAPVDFEVLPGALRLAR